VREKLEGSLSMQGHEWDKTKKLQRIEHRSIHTRIYIRKNLKREFFVIRDDNRKSEEIRSDPNYSKLIRSPNYSL
jgi:hypothetical protein